jgi:hypothetical protein
MVDAHLTCIKKERCMMRDYYTSHRDVFLAGFDRTSLLLCKLAARRYGDRMADAVVREAREAYQSLLPALPYVGGKESPATGWINLAATSLAVYRALQAQYEVATAQLSRYPGFVYRWLGRRQFGKMMARDKVYLARTQARTYPGDWVGTFVEGDGQDFDVGIDYTECGACKFLRAQGADEVAPYLCLTDLVVSRACGFGLKRTMTLAEGDATCDFRYKLGRETDPAWPPRFVKAMAPRPGEHACRG